MQRTSTRTAYENAWMTVREDEFVDDAGLARVYGVVDKPPCVLVIPEQDDGFWLVEQYRYPAQRRMWEFPQGGWPQGRTGTAEELARAELVEETGFTAGRLEHLGRLYAAPGFSSQPCDVFLATDLVPGDPQREETEHDMVHALVPEAELHAMVRGGRLLDGPTLAALTLLHLRA